MHWTAIRILSRRTMHIEFNVDEKIHMNDIKKPEAINSARPINPETLGAKGGTVRTDLLGWQVNTKISSRQDNTISLLENLIEVPQALNKNTKTEYRK